LVLVLTRLAPVLPCVLSLVTSKGAGKSSEEAVVCLSAEHTTANATCDGAHESTIALLAVGVVRVAVGIVGVCLAVLVALGASR